MGQTENLTGVQNDDNVNVVEETTRIHRQKRNVKVILDCIKLINIRYVIFLWGGVSVVELDSHPDHNNRQKRNVKGSFDCKKTNQY